MSAGTDRLLAASQARAALRDGRLRELREFHGFSQRELAEAVGVDESALSRWESGKRVPRIDAAARLAFVLRRLEQAARKGDP
jgi:transcriptional regulator with XRE-family HTH domain